MSKIVITGAGGFVGSHIANALVEQKHEITAFLGPQDIFHSNDVEVKTFDLLKTKDQDHFLKSLSKCDWLIHVAGPSSVSDSYSDPDLFMQIHSVGTSSIMRLANEAGVKKRIYISSAEVYGVSVDYLINEKEACAPKSPYGAAKYSAEWIARVLSAESDLIIIRPFSLYGRRMRSTGVMNRIIDQAKEGKSIDLYDLTPVRDNLYINDLTSMISKVIQLNLKSNILNACSGEGVSINDLAKLVCTLFDVNIPINQTTNTDRPIDTQKLVGCRVKTYKVLGWEPEFSLKTGIQHMLGIKL